MSDIELLTKIKSQLGRARELAAEGGGLTLFYFIEMAIMETDDLAKKAWRKKHLTGVGGPDREKVSDGKPPRLESAT